MDLDGHVALVTGAGGGIGAEIARRLAAAGAAVAAADLDEPAALATAGQIRGAAGGEAAGGEAAGGEAAAPPVAVAGYGLDVTDSASVAGTVDRVTAELGPPDIVVNCAGIDKIARFADTDERTWRSLIEVNLLGTIAVCHAVLGPMTARGWGRIINIGSDAGKVGSSAEAVYSATKGGVIAFTKALAREVAAAGITANCVCPGPTDTPLLNQVAQYSQRLYDSLARAIPLRRIAQPSDIAPLVVFLAGEQAGYITGQALSVSGGLTMS